MVFLRMVMLVLLSCVMGFGCSRNKSQAPATEAPGGKQQTAQPDAKPAPADSPVASVPGAEDALWQTNFEASKAKAKAESKLLLVDFTGSDWCGWCIKLKSEVFDTTEFQTEAPKKFVLVELDFPRQKELPDELKTQNEQLAQQYMVRGFPSILLMDAEGQVIARTGYRPDGPEEYLKHLTEFVQTHDSILKLRAELATVQGLDRAKVLDQLAEAYGKLDNPSDELDAWGKEIIALDADNKAGLKAKYEFRVLLAKAAKLKETREFDEAKRVLDQALAMPGLTGEQKQDAYFSQGECFFAVQDFAGIVACLKQAHEAAPDTEKGSAIQDMLQRFSPVAEAQATVTKIKAELDKAEGLDRAKLLEQMIDARSKLAQFTRDASLAQDIEKWTQEIIALDADNKAGLRDKYLAKQKSSTQPAEEPKTGEPKADEPKADEPKADEPKADEPKQ